MVAWLPDVAAKQALSIDPNYLEVRHLFS